MKQLLKTTIPANSEVEISQHEVDGKMTIVVEVTPKEEFKDGDILHHSDSDGEWNFIVIYKSRNRNCVVSYACIGGKDGAMDLTINDFWFGCNLRLATQDEKQILFDKLEEVGKRWDPEKKVIEDIPEEPKIGDLVIVWDNGNERNAFIDIMDGYSGGVYQTSGDYWYENAIKFDGTKEQLEKVRKGEIG